MPAAKVDAYDEPGDALGATRQRRGARVVALAALLLGVLPAGARGATPIAWIDCGARLQCATFAVPLDHRRPEAGTIKLALVRRPADDPARRLGSLFINPGGPGASGVKFVSSAALLLPAEVRARLDLVGFDPRGVGFSTPVRCFASAEEQAAILGADDPAPQPFGDQLKQLARTARWTRACAERDARGLLPHVSTAAVARDLDLLREAVGDKSLRYLGYSYGTLVGATYANLFPDRAGALVLDGAFDAEGWTDRPLAADREQAVLGFEKTLDAFALACEAAGERCALAEKGWGVERRVEALLRRLRSRPLPVEVEGEQVPLTFGFAAAVVMNELYAAQAYAPLAAALAAAEDGDGQPLVRLALERSPLALGQDAQDPYNNSPEANEAVNCLDRAYPRRPDLWPALARRTGLLAPNFGEATVWANVACATWPVQAAERFSGPWNRVRRHPVLVVGTRFDPATPYAWAERLTEQLGAARLLRRDGVGHTAFGTSRCVDEHVARYLLDAKLPPEGTVCASDIVPFAAPTARSQRRVPTLPPLLP